jgi:hypothetical protein
MDSLRSTFATYPEDEIRAILGTNAMRTLGFDPTLLEPIGAKIGPALADIRAGR